MVFHQSARVGYRKNLFPDTPIKLRLQLGLFRTSISFFANKLVMKQIDIIPNLQELVLEQISNKQPLVQMKGLRTCLRKRHEQGRPLHTLVFKIDTYSTYEAIKSRLIDLE
jgi:ABC-type proline/glycine betaine transport system ATPase subunit